MKLKSKNINIRAFLHHSAGSVLLSVIFRRADRDLAPCAGKNQESRPALPGDRRATCRHRPVGRYPVVAGPEYCGDLALHLDGYLPHPVDRSHEHDLSHG